MCASAWSIVLNDTSRVQYDVPYRLIHGHETRDETNAKTSEHTSDDKQWELHSGSLHCDADAENEVSENDTPLASEDIANGGTR